MGANFYDILSKLWNKPDLISPVEVAKTSLSPKELANLRQMGMSISGLQEIINKEVAVQYDRISLYQEVVSACLTKDTKIPTLDGRILTIGDLLKEHQDGKVNYVYSCTPEGGLTFGEIQKVWYQGDRECLRVWLDNGKYVDSSYNHKFILRDGSLCLAENLKVGDSLMPFHKRTLKQNKGYEAVYDNLTKKWKSTYKSVYKWFYGIDTNILNKGIKWCESLKFWDIHHIDFSKVNNNPENLRLMTRVAHMKLHKDSVDERSKSDSWKAQLKERRDKMWMDYTCDNLECKKVFQIRSTKVMRKGIKSKTHFCSPECQNIVTGKITSKRCKGLQIIPRETRTCGCGCGFKKDVRINSTWRFKRGHGNRGANASLAWRNSQGKIQENLGIPSWNHKITKIEKIGVHEVYDITVSGEHNFGLDIGIFIKNSQHPIVNGAIQIYASTATVYNKEHNATIWVTSKSEAYQKAIEKLLEKINIEEKLFDFASAVVMYGDLFLDLNAQPGVGILSMDDSKAPVEFYRIEKDGALLGFFHQHYSSQTNKDSTVSLLPPWKLVHLYLTNTMKRRPVFGDNYGYRTSIIGVGGNTMQESSHYGSPLVMPALPVLKRLRLAEDSILMGRATRTPLKYLYSVGIPNDGTNIEAVQEIMKSYANILKRARSVDTTAGQQSYNDRLSNLGMSEDLLCAVWGDVNQLKVEKLGGDVDIKWLTDVDKLEQQLCTALAIPQPLLGGTAGEGGSGFDNGGSLEQMDIRFARNVNRIQRSLIQGITRLCQIHLSYLGLDPSTELFQLHMHDVSDAAAKEKQENLKLAISTTSELFDALAKVVGEDKLHRENVFNLCNENYLKLPDIQYEDLLLPEGKKNTAVPAEPGAVAGGQVGEELTAEGGEEASTPEPLNASRNSERRKKIMESKIMSSQSVGDLKSFTFQDQKIWESLYGEVRGHILKEKL